MAVRPAARLDFILKVASRCNLNCSYCYVYNKGDSTWRDRPHLMPEAVFQAALERIRRHCLSSGQDSVRITFHGGEPCLAGPERFGEWCRTAREGLARVANVDFAVQTNGTLVDERWLDVFRGHEVEVGVSMDGPPEIHDTFRVDHRGRGSYLQVLRGLTELREAGVPFGVLCVIPLGSDGVRVHRHFVGLGVTWINYLFPQFTHDTMAEVRERYGPTPCADFLVPILEDWWSNGTLRVNIRIFWDIAWMLLGGESQIDMFGNRPFRFAFVEADGSIEGLDVLRVCEEGKARTGLNVLFNDFTEIASVSELHRAAIFDGLPLPEGCRGCHEATTCAGGYLSHRYSRSRGFDNPSVWCDDLLRLFGALRQLLQVNPEETARRRTVLADMVGTDSGGDVGRRHPVEARL